MREFKRCFKEVSRVFHESFKEEEVSRMFRIFQGGFQRVLRKFQENFPGVSKKFHVAWNSSQLPKAEGGLVDVIFRIGDVFSLEVIITFGVIVIF